MKSKKILTILLSILLVVSLTSGAMAATFSDVPENHPQKAAIDFCADKAFVNGRGGGIFDPSGSISRGEFVIIWARTFHARQHTFTDATRTKSELDNAIVLMQGIGFIDGISGSLFGASGNITREQVAKIVENTYLLGIDGKKGYEAYSDWEHIGTWARNAVAVCREKGIFDGITSGGSFDPQRDMTRAEVCRIIWNIMKDESAEPSGEEHSITIGAVVGGTITADKTSAAAGETVTLTLTGNAGMSVTGKDGYLKVNGTPITGNTFEMPDEDVVITAKFGAGYDVSIAPMTNGSVTASHDFAGAGVTVTLTIEPDEGYRLKAGSLKFDDTAITGTSFVMPAEDVVIHAEFEEIPT